MIAEMKHRVTLQQPVLTTDGAGGFTETWSNLADTPVVSAAIMPLHSGDLLKDGQLQATGLFKVIVRYRADVTPSLRMVDEEGVVYSITSVTAQNGAKSFLELQALVRGT